MIKSKFNNKVLKIPFKFVLRILIYINGVYPINSKKKIHLIFPRLLSKPISFKYRLGFGQRKE